MNTDTLTFIVSIIHINLDTVMNDIKNAIISSQFDIKDYYFFKNYKGALSYKIKGKTSNIQSLKNKIQLISKDKQCDIFIQPETLKPRGLVAFDMDSTLIQHEVIVELAREAQVSDKVSAITESAMRGEIDFCESFRRRMKLLKGINVSVVDGIYQNLNMTPGADRLLKFLKNNGYKVAIISGGFTYFANRIKDKYGLDYVCANELIAHEGVITGETGNCIVDADVKANKLQTLMLRYGLKKEDVVAVGDGANDLKMIAKAGLGVAYHGKPKVREQAPYAINYSGLDALMVYLQHNN